MSVLTVGLGVLAFLAFQAAANIQVNIITDANNLETYLHNEDALRKFANNLKDLKLENSMLKKDLEEISNRMDNELDAQKNELVVLQNILSEKVKTDSRTDTQSPNKRPKNCAEAMTSDDQSGLFYLYLPDVKPFRAYCLKDPNNGPAWTVIQRRQDGTLDFYRDWIDYKYGFGNLYGEFWLGLQKIHLLTKQQTQELWVQLEDFDAEERFAKYTDFAVGDEESKYLLKSIGTFSGDASDSLKYHLNSKFSTKDSDNDGDPNGSCATSYVGAWWYKSCHDSNLNGQYLRYKEVENSRDSKGIEWYKWRGHYSLKYSHMAIRPKLN